MNCAVLAESSSEPSLAHSQELHQVEMMRVLLPATVILAAWILLYFQIDPIPTWFYVFAWYPTLILLDAIASRLHAGPSMLWRRPMVFALAWSPIVWLLFEAANFRLHNWYYVFLPHAVWQRWTGIILSFATVVPMVLLAERALQAAGVFSNGRGPVVIVRPSDTRWAVLLGIALAVLALGSPRSFFPLIWGAVFLIIDPILFHRTPAYSLIGDLARGQWGRIGRLMLGGLGIGLLWECYNFWARGKWVYTVPWLEHTKLFEMPPFGFLGFPFFALEAWSLYHALCALRIAVPMAGTSTCSRTRTAAAALVAAVFAVTILLGMEERTISSTVPRLQDVPGITAPEIDQLEAADVRSVFLLADSDPQQLQATGRLSAQAARELVDKARLATLRGIGTRHAAALMELGIRNVCELAQQDPDILSWEIEHRAPAPRPTPPEIRVWIRAAGRACSD
jgi:hypothetical protein